LRKALLAELNEEYGIGGLPRIVTSILGAKLVGQPLKRFVEFDLFNRSPTTWADYSPTHRMADFFRFVNNEAGGRFFRDKVTAFERCVAEGVPTLPISGVALRAHNGVTAAPLLADLQSLREFIAGDAMPADAFVKPAGGLGGEGAFATFHTAAGWRVEGAHLDSNALAARIGGSGDPKGVLIQPRMTASDCMAAVGGQFGLPTLRIQTALTRSGPQVVYIVQKILGGSTNVDNFSAGAKGNLIAAVDPASGEYGAAYGKREGRRHVLSRFTNHPRLGARIMGTRLPVIDDAVAVALAAARAFPEAPLIGSDIAVTTEGVRLVEINNSPDQRLGQIACGKGVAALFRDVVPELALPADRLATAKLLFAARINKRWEVVRFD
jgi:Sugar-transfer associated ATP-grasp